MNDIKPSRTEIISETEAKGVLQIHERREAMDAALDIAATTTKMQARYALAEANKGLAEAQAKYAKAESLAESLLDAAGLDMITHHPLTGHVIEVVKAISGVEIPPERAWHWSDTHYSRVTREGAKFMVRTSSVLDFDISMTDESGDTTTTARNKPVEMELDISKYAGLVDAVNARDAVSKEVDAARAVRDAAKERLDNHAAHVDVARVQLQRSKLKDMGSVGEQALTAIDQVIAASEGKGYLGLL